MAGKAKNRGLGRGLDALFADQAPAVQPDRADRKDEEGSPAEGREAVSYIDINEIKPNENQPRKTFDEEKISELAASITEHGIIQPLVVRKRKRGYEIVAGERRWRAARKAELKEVPCLIREFTDEENMLIAIIENMQREDLNPIEEAEGLHQMIKTYGLTQEEVSKSVSKSRPYITNALRLLKLPVEIQQLVTEGKLTTGHARALIPIQDKVLQAQLCQEDHRRRPVRKEGGGAGVRRGQGEKEAREKDQERRYASCGAGIEKPVRHPSQHQSKGKKGQHRAGILQY